MWFFLPTNEERIFHNNTNPLGKPCLSRTGSQQVVSVHWAVEPGSYLWAAPSRANTLLLGHSQHSHSYQLLLRRRLGFATSVVARPKIRKEGPVSCLSITCGQKSPHNATLGRMRKCNTRTQTGWHLLTLKNKQRRGWHLADKAFLGHVSDFKSSKQGQRHRQWRISSGQPL